MNFSIYLAGKIPKGAEEHRDFDDWRKTIKQLVESKRKDFLESKIICMDPHTLQGDMIPIEEFFGRDVHMIAVCDAVLIDAREKIGAGTAQEILIAKYYKKPVITVIPRESHYWRRIFVHGCEVDYKHPFIFSTSDAVVEDFEQAVVWLLRYFSGELKPRIKGIEIIDHAQKSYMENHSHKDEVMNGWKKDMEG